LYLQGSIDQVDALLRFDSSSEQLLQWDSQIQSMCNQLNGIIDRMADKGIKLEA
jgi:CSN4/RPN5/eIF3a helix turn helix domain